MKALMRTLPFLLLLLAAAGCLQSGSPADDSAPPAWSSTLVLAVENTGDFPVNVSTKVTYTDNQSIVHESAIELGPGQAKKWSLDLLPTNYTTNVTAWAESRQDVNPDPPTVSASVEMEFAAAQCPHDSTTAYTVDVEYEDADTPVAGPYISESVRATGDLETCA